MISADPTVSARLLAAAKSRLDCSARGMNLHRIMTTNIHYLLFKRADQFRILSAGERNISLSLIMNSSQIGYPSPSE